MAQQTSRLTALLVGTHRIVKFHDKKIIFDSRAVVIRVRAPFNDQSKLGALLFGMSSICANERSITDDGAAMCCRENDIFMNERCPTSIPSN